MFPNFSLDLALSVLLAISGFICFIVTLFRTGSIKKSINKFLEVFELKYDTIDSKRNEEKFAQSFSELVDDYILDPQTGMLEKLPQKKNIQAKIQSYLDCALDRMLEKFLPNVVEERDEVAGNFTRAKEDLAVVGEAMEVAEDYRVQLGMDEKASLSDIYTKLGQLSEELKLKLSDLNKPKEVSADVKKYEENS